MIFGMIERLRGWAMPYPFWLASLGARGEYLVRRDFHRRGYHCLATNWRHRHGEIDLIVANAKRLVFVEVKTRGGPEPPPIGDTISHDQKRRLRRLAEIYRNRWPARDVPWQFVLALVSVPRTDTRFCRGIRIQLADLF